jgi:hypothetical protein
VISEEIVRGRFDSIVRSGVKDREGRKGRGLLGLLFNLLLNCDLLLHAPVPGDRCRGLRYCRKPR